MTRAERQSEPSDLRGELEALHPDAFGWALSCCRWNAAEAEDVLQDAYLRVLDGRARFAGRSSFKTWLFGVIRMTARERRRQLFNLQRRFRSDPEAIANASGRRTATPESQRLGRELSALPGRQREVLHLVFYGELSIREASEVMHVSLGTARVHYERGKARLRERLGIRPAATGKR